MEEKKMNIFAADRPSGKVLCFIKKHWVFFTIIAILFLSTFFIRGSSVQVRYLGADTYEYVRLDYSVYGYCINVRPMQKESKQSARDLTRQVLFMDMESSLAHVCDTIAHYYGDQESFTLKVKGYMYNTNDRRDELIQYVRSLGYAADAII